MAIRKTQIFTFLMIPVVVVLGWLLIDGVKTKIEMDEAIRLSELRVRHGLERIRDAEKAYRNIYGKYTDNWDSLAHFIRTGVVYNVQKREILHKRPAHLAHLGDSVEVQYDTLGSTPVMQKLFPASKYPNFNPDQIGHIPGKEGKMFKITVNNEFEKSNVTVPIIEVVDPYPVDPTRSEDNENPRRKFLRFGSQSDVTLSGNWED